LVENLYGTALNLAATTLLKVTATVTLREDGGGTASTTMRRGLESALEALKGVNPIVSMSPTLEAAPVKMERRLVVLEEEVSKPVSGEDSSTRDSAAKEEVSWKESRKVLCKTCAAA
jgi:hypothetical protein